MSPTTAAVAGIDMGPETDRDAEAILGWPDEFIEHGSVPVLRKKHGITADALVEKVLPLLRKKASAQPSAA